MLEGVRHQHGEFPVGRAVQAHQAAHRDDAAERNDRALPMVFM
jgi:hypothetical protein